MKNRKNYLTVLAAITLCTLFTFTACGKKSNNASDEKMPSSVSQSKPDAPSLDIFSAALFGNLEAIRQHIKAGTDLDQKDPYGSTPLIITAVFGKAEAAKLLIEAEADVNITNNDGSTALHSAAFLCRTEIVKALLENGADKTIKNNFGSTPLESVTGPFDQVKPVYDQFSRDLGPLGLKLDYEHIKKTRPVIAEMLSK